MAANQTSFLSKDPTSGLSTEVKPTVTSAGAGDAGKVVGLDATGRIDGSVLPIGVGAPTQQLPATEALLPGDLVNVYGSGTGGTTFSVRKADASAVGKECHGFVTAAVATGATATVYGPGAENTAAAGLSPGTQYLSATTPGRCTTTPPNTPSSFVQRVGAASSATVLLFEPATPSYVNAAS